MPNTYPELKLHIAGTWRHGEGRRTHRVVNPATGDTLAELPLATPADLDDALAAAEQGFQQWRRTPAEQRGRVLKQAAAFLRSDAERFARVATLEQGKTLTETRLELHGAADLLEFYGEECTRSHGRLLVRPTGMRAMVLKEPVGPVAAFAPWNFPLHNPARKLGAPLAAGCSVILKPAEETPASAILMLQALLDAGLPDGVANLVFGIPDEVSRHLLASPIIRKLSFTGSTVVGQHLMKLAADTCKRTTMELGGHAPVIVCEDADLDQATQMLVTAKYRNAGQVCVSPTRFYIHDTIYQAFTEAFAEKAANLRVGNGLDDGVNMGPLANARRHAAMPRLVEDAVAHGGRVLTGGQAIDGPGYFWKPTVLTDVPDDARMMREEPFGPLALLRPYTDLDAVLHEANRLPYGLAAYAFTDSSRRAMQIADGFESGMVGINVTRMGWADAPFGGVKYSGHGAEDGREGLDACLVTKTVHHG
ncbi:MAG: NAD-dependent succinate-semialdehyde dehydrogenase [Pigmentiphaga sp.]|nr:NAD-dependent succinate-semialdehyde dehydrogenase [Pigmentiphaga sp.]